MKIAIISDSHDNLTNLKKAISKITDMKVEAIIHCGDLSAPFMVPVLGETGIPTYYTVGNNEAEIHYMLKQMDKYDNIHFMRMPTGEYIGELELGGKKIAFTHYPAFAEALASTKKYDVVFHGHSHKQREDIIESTLIVNPGEVSNIKSDGSFAIYDTDTGKVEFFDLN